MWSLAGMANMANMANLANMAGMGLGAMGMGGVPMSLSAMATGTGEFGGGPSAGSGDDPKEKEVMKDLDGPRCFGICKNYDPQKGYGFLRVEGHEKDIFFSRRDLPREMQERVALTGHKFSFDLYLAHDGRLQAKRCMWQGIVQGPNAARAAAAASAVGVNPGTGLAGQTLASLMGAVGGGSMHGGASLGTMLMAAGAQQNAAAAMGFLQPGSMAADVAAMNNLMLREQQAAASSAEAAMAMLHSGAGVFGGGMAGLMSPSSASTAMAAAAGGMAGLMTPSCGSTAMAMGMVAGPVVAGKQPDYGVNMSSAGMLGAGRGIITPAFLKNASPDGALLEGSMTAGMQHGGMAAEMQQQGGMAAGMQQQGGMAAGMQQQCGMAAAMQQGGMPAGMQQCGMGGACFQQGSMRTVFGGGPAQGGIAVDYRQQSYRSTSPPRGAPRGIAVDYQQQGYRSPSPPGGLAVDYQQQSYRSSSPPGGGLAVDYQQQSYRSPSPPGGLAVDYQQQSYRSPSPPGGIAVDYQQQGYRSNSPPMDEGSMQGMDQRSGIDFGDPAEKHRGQIKSYSPGGPQGGGGYGFIHSEMAGGDCWFSRADLPIGVQTWSPTRVKGLNVVFLLRPSREGKRQAKSVELDLSSGSAYGPAIDGGPCGFGTPVPARGSRRGAGGDDDEGGPPEGMSMGGGGHGQCAGSLPGLSKQKAKFKDEVMDGSRAFAVVKSLEKDRGLLRCSDFAQDLPFNFEDLPPALQQRAMERGPSAGLAPETEVIFTLTYAEGNGKPSAREVMPIPGQEDLFFGDVVTYNTNSGYGFIKPAEDSVFTHDVYFNLRDVQECDEEDRRKNLLGVNCGFNIKMNQDGRPQAKRIELITKPDGQGAGDESAESTGRILQGTIKTFKPSSGYGFIACPHLGRDVWFPRREVPGDWLKRDLKGIDVNFELWMTKDEKPQARALKEPNHPNMVPGSAPMGRVGLPAAFGGGGGCHGGGFAGFDEEDMIEAMPEMMAQARGLDWHSEMSQQQALARGRHPKEGGAGLPAAFAGGKWEPVLPDVGAAPKAAPAKLGMHSQPMSPPPTLPPAGYEASAPASPQMWALADDSPPPATTNAAGNVRIVPPSKKAAGDEAGGQPRRIAPRVQPPKRVVPPRQLDSPQPEEDPEAKRAKMEPAPTPATGPQHTPLKPGLISTGSRDS